MRNPKFQVFKSSESEFYFRLRATGGEIVLASEGYTAKANCHSGVESVKENSVIDDRYLREDSVDGRFYFTIVAGNGEIIGKSEMYDTMATRDQGVGVVKEIAGRAPVEDTTL